MLQHIVNKGVGQELSTFPVDITLGLSVRRHVPTLSDDFSLIVHCQYNTINFKQTLFISFTERVT
jgi:hypothetical protein